MPVPPTDKDSRWGGGTAPASHAALITPADSDLAMILESFVVGTNGAVKITTAEDEVLTLPDVGQACLWPIRVKRIWSTGTTASDIVGLW